MDPIKLVETLGIPIATVVAFGFFIYKQNKFIQDELTRELRESFRRIETILVKLIDQQKTLQVEQKRLESSYHGLVEIIAALSGNGMKDKFMRILEKGDTSRNK